ncbi:MAG: SwmB domain-containing protein, partial [Defluviicoccus sp.]|nr:SwmB domain-containing protein [Defluviicoccus sp.]
MKRFKRCIPLLRRRLRGRAAATSRLLVLAGLAALAAVAARPAAAQNSAATGMPEIVGSADVGATLTATTGTIADADGLPAESAFTWQWVQVDGMTETDIDGETSATYTVAMGDLGKTIKVKASFTDSASNSEGPLVSAATRSVEPRPTLRASFHPPEQPVDEGSTARVTLRLVASKRPADKVVYRAFTPENVGETATAVVDYDYFHPRLREAPASEFTAQGDGTYVYMRTFEIGTSSDAVADGEETFHFDVGDLAVFANPHYDVSILGDENGARFTIKEPAMGSPAISGSADVGATLTATTGTIADADGLPADSAFTWQWVRVDGMTETDIDGETSDTYTVTDADLGKMIKVKASFSDNAGNSEGPLASAATPSVDPTPSLTASFHPPQQTVDEGSTARVTLRLVASKQPADTVRYRALTPTVGAATATGGADYTAILPALQEAPVSAFMARGDGSYVYERTFDLATMSDAVPDSGETFYFDVVQLVVTANLHYNVSIQGDQNGALITINEAATGSPAITGTPEVGQTLMASKGTIADVDGLPAESAFTWQWVRVDGGTETDIDGETGQSYTLVPADIGKTIRVRASFTDNAGHSEGPLIGDPTQTVPDTVAPAFVSAAANGRSLVITFDEELAPAAPPLTAFTVKKTPAGGAETTVTLAATPSIAGRTVTLTLSEALAADDGDVKVSYAA